MSGRAPHSIPPAPHIVFLFHLADLVDNLSFSIVKEHYRIQRKYRYIKYTYGIVLI